ncbi:MAG: hypothetical protein JW963_10980 [Anaerolineales bacterium]|nr:hypothetical protein [Anaerolineales bacterium]
MTYLIQSHSDIWLLSFLAGKRPENHNLIFGFFLVDSGRASIHSAGSIIYRQSLLLKALLEFIAKTNHGQLTYDISGMPESFKSLKVKNLLAQYNPDGKYYQA